MTDLSTLSDDQLKALYAQGAKAPADMSDEELKAAYQAQAPQTSSAVPGLIKAAGTGVAKGAIGLAGLPGDVNNLVGQAVLWAGDKLGLPRPSPEAVAKAPDLLPESRTIQGVVEKGTGKFYEPQTRGERFAQAFGEFAPATFAGPGGLIRKALQTAGSAGGSELAGELTQGTAYEPYARVAGALAGGAAPDALRRGLTPLPVAPERQRLLDTLTQEGVTSLTAGQRTGNKAVQYAESILGDALGAGGRTSEIQREGQRQFTEAAMRRAGTGPNATPEVLAENQRRLGQEFADLSARNNVVFDQQFSRDINHAIRDYARVPPSQQRAIVENYIDDIVQHATNTGGMPGAYYQEMRSRLSRQANGLKNNDPTLSDALRNIRNALDDNMGRSISPADRAAWNQARREYGAQKVLEKSASRAGEATAEGNIVPANLRNTVAAENRGAYARGEGNFSELARAGAGVMAPLPNSGTGQRVAVNTLASLLGGGVGSIGGVGLGSALGAAAGAAAGPAVAGRILMNPVTQRYLGNQMIAAPTQEVRNHARLSRVINALLASPR